VTLIGLPARDGERQARAGGAVAVRREIVESADVTAALAAYRAQGIDAAGIALPASGSHDEVPAGS
jgi:hypothetical protein